MTVTMIDHNIPMLKSYIPENFRLDGIEYGAHVSMIGHTGYHIRPAGTKQWFVARQTPAIGRDEADETLDTLLDEIAELKGM